MARPSAKVRLGIETTSFRPHDSWAAGEEAAFTPMTRTKGLTAAVMRHAPAAPLPPPTGTTMTKRPGSSSSISRVAVATPSRARA